VRTSPVQLFSLSWAEIEKFVQNLDLTHPTRVLRGEDSREMTKYRRKEAGGKFVVIPRMGKNGPENGGRKAKREQRGIFKESGRVSAHFGQWMGMRIISMSCSKMTITTRVEHSPDMAY
jgi:hypothetical protein